MLAFVFVDEEGVYLGGSLEGKVRVGVRSGGYFYRKVSRLIFV